MLVPPRTRYRTPVRQDHQCGTPGHNALGVRPCSHMPVQPHTAYKRPGLVNCTLRPHRESRLWWYKNFQQGRAGRKSSTGLAGSSQQHRRLRRCWDWHTNCLPHNLCRKSVGSSHSYVALGHSALEGCWPRDRCTQMGSPDMSHHRVGNTPLQPCMQLCW